jgi:hypothetical protein
MVGQCLYGIRPPKEYPKPEHVDLVPLHSSRYFDRHGNLLEKGHNPDERHVMVSRMKVLPWKVPCPQGRWSNKIESSLLDCRWIYIWSEEKSFYIMLSTENDHNGL